MFTCTPGCFSAVMTGRKSRALQVPPVVPYTALENFSKALYGLFSGYIW